METLISANDRFNFGAFILNDNRVPYTPYYNCSNIFLTQDRNNALKNEIIKIIEESKEVLKICSFIITDTQIYETLIDKARNTNVAIFILTQFDKEKLKNVRILSDDLTDDEIKENSNQIHLKYLHNLYQEGVHVRAALSAHAKFIISDRHTAIIMSANMTKASFTINTESGVYLKDEESDLLDKLFDIIFLEGTNYTQFIIADKKKSFVVQSEVKIKANCLPQINQSRLRYTYENEVKTLYLELLNIINGAYHYIYLSSYSFRDLERIPEITKAIKNAIGRGVKIKIFCRGMNFRLDHLIGCNKMNALGCEIYADIYNHSKVIITENDAMLFTANIDGQYGLINGFEVGYLLDDVQRLEFVKIFDHLVESSFYGFKSEITRLEFFQSYISYELYKGINGPVFPQDITIEIKKDLEIHLKDFMELPIYYAKDKNDDFLIVNNLFFHCSFAKGFFKLIKKIPNRFDLERFLLKYMNLKIIVA